ncbi:extracellular solute-binding protein [Paenibacillus sp. CC-CFT747]|nr:extracellular solute-binding protein [Paenibacillus sp. CC-CFT747]
MQLGGGTTSPADSASSNPTPTGTIAPVNPDELTANLTWFGLASQKDFEDRYGQYIKKKFPKLTITYINQTDQQKMEQVIASGTPLDMYLSSAGELREDWLPANMAQELDPLMKTHNVDISPIKPAYLEQVTIDKKHYLLPISDNKFVMYYNKDIFDRFGVKYPWDGMTWDEALDLSKQLTRNEGGKQYIGLWMSPKHYIRVTQNSSNMVDAATNKATVNNDNCKFIFEKIFYNFTRDPGLQQRANEKWLAHADFNKDFLVGMYVYTSGWMNSADTSLAMNWDIAAVPQFKEYPGLNTQPYATYAGITSTSKNKDAAMEVLKYLISEEYQTIMSKRGVITPLTTKSVRDAAFTDYPFAKSKNIKALFYGKPAPGRVMTEYDELVIEKAFDEDVVREIAKGKMDVNSALRKAEETSNKLIQEQLTKK